jgi:hypothetical protein
LRAARAVRGELEPGDRSRAEDDGQGNDRDHEDDDVEGHLQPTTLSDMASIHAPDRIVTVAKGQMRG